MKNLKFSLRHVFFGALSLLLISFFISSSETAVAQGKDARAEAKARANAPGGLKDQAKAKAKARVKSSTNLKKIIRYIKDPATGCLKCHSLNDIDSDNNNHSSRKYEISMLKVGRVVSRHPIPELAITCTQCHQSHWKIQTLRQNLDFSRMTDLQICEAIKRAPKPHLSLTEWALKGRQFPNRFDNSGISTTRSHLNKYNKWKKSMGIWVNGGAKCDGWSLRRNQPNAG